MIEVIEYIVNGAMWAVLFFSVGYQLGKVSRVLDDVEEEIHEIKHKIGEKHD